MIDMDESFKDFKKRCPEAASRIEKSIKKEQEQELLQECKRLHKKKLSDKELFKFHKKNLDSLILEEQAYEVKKKLSLYSPEVRSVLLENLTGLSISEAAERTDTLIEIYHKIFPAEPIGQSERKDWPEKIDEAARKADLDRKFEEAMS